MLFNFIYIICPFDNVPFNEKTESELRLANTLCFVTGSEERVVTVLNPLKNVEAASQVDLLYPVITVDPEKKF